MLSVNSLGGLKFRDLHSSENDKLNLKIEHANWRRHLNVEKWNEWISNDYTIAYIEWVSNIPNEKLKYNPTKWNYHFISWFNDSNHKRFETVICRCADLFPK